MVRFIFIAANFAVLLGCSSEQHRNAEEFNSTMVSVGQPWNDAVQSVRSAGYALHDGDNLQMEPAPEAYIELEGDQALMIDRNAATDAVSSIQQYAQWSNGKHAVASPPVSTFHLPPASR